MLHGVAARGTVMVVGVTPPYNGALPQSTDTTAPAGFDRTGIFSVVSLTIVAQRAAERTTAAASIARFMARYGNAEGVFLASRFAHSDFDAVHGNRHVRRLIGRQSCRGEDVRAGLVAVDRAGEASFTAEFRLDERGVTGAEVVARSVARRDSDGDGARVDAGDLDLILARPRYPRHCSAPSLPSAK